MLLQHWQSHPLFQFAVLRELSGNCRNYGDGIFPILEWSCESQDLPEGQLRNQAAFEEVTLTSSWLLQLDLIIIHQQVELLEMILGTETSNKYEIKNGLGQRVYFAVEESLCFNRTFCAPLRSCALRIVDNTGREVIAVHRPLRCISCWCPCYLQELEIQAPPGIVVGYVVQKWDPFLPKFTIQNENKEEVLKIVGPYATCGFFGDVDFEVKTINEKLTIGKISKYWSGFVNGVFTNTDNFGIHVPADLDVKIKAAMIGACFLIDLMFFEHSLAGL
uniref:Phospholipid scramblase n=1 Tax=Ornithorhynchus anatinus TaxID=9258 RepID=F7AXM4_ORNAN